MKIKNHNDTLDGNKNSFYLIYDDIIEWVWKEEKKPCEDERNESTQTYGNEDKFNFFFSPLYSNATQWINIIMERERESEKEKKNM